MLALTRLRSCEQRRGDGLTTGPRGEFVEQQHVDLFRFFRVLAMNTALNGADAGVGLNDRVIGAITGAWSRLPKTADAQVHQAFVRSREIVITNAQAIDHARTKILDDHIGVDGEGMDDLPTFRRADVCSDAAFATIDDMKKAGVAVALAADVSLDITSTDTFDLDDIGALVSEQRKSEQLESSRRTHDLRAALLSIEAVIRLLDGETPPPDPVARAPCAHRSGTFHG